MVEIMKIKNNNYLTAFISATLMMLIASISHASDSNWHSDTKSYRVYLGVISASAIKNNPKLIDQEKSLHGGLHNATSSSQHIMVSIFTKNGNKRLLNATVIAKVKNKKIIGRKNIIKPLEKMLTSGTVTYGNYFEIPKKGKYVIDVDIYQSNKNGSEKASFIYEKQ